jgi:enamine deaminase RidA (YjgF/YER057c/UK114 family)
VRNATLYQVLLVAVLASAAPLHEPQATRPAVQFFNSPEGEKLGVPFSEAVRVGDAVHAVAIGIKSGTHTIVPGGIEAETKQTLENLRGILERSGTSMDRVVKCTVMMADMNEWSRMNAVYATYFE